MGASGWLSQSKEHATLDLEVVSSSPVFGTKQNKTKTEKKQSNNLKMHTTGYNRNWAEASSLWFPKSALRHPEHHKSSHTGAMRYLQFEINSSTQHLSDTVQTTT